MHKSNLDLAPPSQRVSATAASMGLIAAAFLLHGGLNVWRNAQEWTRAKTRLASTAQLLARSSARGDSAPKASDADAQKLASIEHRLETPWDGPWGAVEQASAVSKGAVSLTSMNQSLTADNSVEVNLSAKASSHEAVLSFFEAIQGQAGVADARLVSQDRSGAKQDAEVFQLTFQWPQVRGGATASGSSQ